MAFVYVLGAIYFYIICNFVINAPVSIGKTVMSCSVLVAPGNIALAILAALVAKRIIRDFKSSKPVELFPNLRLYDKKNTVLCHSVFF